MAHRLLLSMASLLMISIGSAAVHAQTATRHPQVGLVRMSTYRVVVAANFFTMASSSLRSLSFRLVE